MGGKDLISFEKAAARLGISESAVDELVDEGRLAVHRHMGNVWLDAGEVAELARAMPLPAEQPAEEQKPKERAADPGSPLARIRGLRQSGVREVIASEAAGLLRVSVRQVFHLLNEGRLNGEKRGGRRWIDLMEVEMYAMDQAHWARMDGPWTAYGKQPSSDHVGLSLVSEARERVRGGGQAEEMLGGDRRLTLAEAAELLGLSKPTVHRMARSGQLAFEKVKRFDPESSRRRATRTVLSFRLADVMAAGDARERKAWQRTIPEERWNRKTAGKPFIRTKIETPPNDLLITPVEAARMLGVSQPLISNLVRRGRLFGWQEHPGKQGSRLWLSGNQVQRYANDPERLKRREAHKRGQREPSPTGQETNDEIWREDVGLADGVQFSLKSTVQRDYGEFFNTRQAAKALGVSKGAVGALRERGRLSGYQKPRNKKDGGGTKWWFYRKDDVYNLLADGEYLRNRNRGRQAKLLSLGREIPDMTAEWEKR
jgi:predicted XRE-type DNA-binding protein